MLALLRKKKLPQPPQSQAASSEPALTAGYDRLLLLIPEGAYTYGLVVFTDIKSAAAYVDRHLLPSQPFHALWASDPDDPGGRRQPGEAVVLVADDTRADIVQPYSFTDVEAARSFIAGGSDGGPGPGHPLVFWTEPVSVPRGLTLPPPGPGSQVAQNYPSSPPVVATQTLAYATGGATPSGAGSAVVELEPQMPGLMSRVAEWPAWDGLAPRMVAASRASKAIYYDAVDDDDYADGRAVLIVLVGALSAGFGALGGTASAPLWHFAGAIVGWLLAVSAVHVIAITALPGKRPAHSYRRLAVALGLAYSPAIFLMLGIVPIYGPMFTLGVLAWLGVTAVVAIETSLELDREGALVTAIAGWIVLFAFTLIVPQLLT